MLAFPLPEPWRQCLDDQWRVYFYNERTKIPSWSHPLLRAHHAIIKAYRWMGSFPESQRGEVAEKQLQVLAVQAEAELQNWREVGTQNGRSYYFHIETRQTTWDNPYDIVRAELDLEAEMLSLLSSRDESHLSPVHAPEVPEEVLGAFVESRRGSISEASWPPSLPSPRPETHTRDTLKHLQEALLDGRAASEQPQASTDPSLVDSEAAACEMEDPFLAMLSKHEQAHCEAAAMEDQRHETQTPKTEAHCEAAGVAEQRHGMQTPKREASASEMRLCQRYLAQVYCETAHVAEQRHEKRKKEASAAEAKLCARYLAKVYCQAARVADRRLEKRRANEALAEEARLCRGYLAKVYATAAAVAQQRHEHRKKQAALQKAAAQRLAQQALQAEQEEAAARTIAAFGHRWLGRRTLLERAEAPSAEEDDASMAYSSDYEAEQSERYSYDLEDGTPSSASPVSAGTASAAPVALEESPEEVAEAAEPSPATSPGASASVSGLSARSRSERILGSRWEGLESSFWAKGSTGYQPLPVSKVPESLAPLREETKPEPAVQEVPEEDIATPDLQEIAWSVKALEAQATDFVTGLGRDSKGFEKMLEVAKASYVPPPKMAAEPVLIRRSTRKRLAPSAVPRVAGMMPQQEELPKQTVIDEDAQVAPPESRRPSSTDERLPGPAPWAQRVLQGLAKEPRPRYRSKSQSSYEEAHLPPSELSKAETQPMMISTLEEVGGAREELPPINSSGARSMVSRDPKHSAQDLRILEAGHYAVKALAKHVDKAKELQKTLRRENRQVYRAYSNVFEQMKQLDDSPTRSATLPARQASSKARASRKTLQLLRR